MRRVLFLCVVQFAFGASKPPNGKPCKDFLSMTDDELHRHVHEQVAEVLRKIMNGEPLTAEPPVLPASKAATRPAEISAAFTNGRGQDINPTDPQMLKENFRDTCPECFKDGRTPSTFGGFYAGTIEKFIADAQTGKVHELASTPGQILNGQFVAPYKAYEWLPGGNLPKRYVLFQHGNYMIFEARDQPEIPNGMLTLYRGVGQTKAVRFSHFETDNAGFKRAQALYSQYQYWISSNPGRGFIEPYNRINRSFNDHLKVADNFRKYLLENPNGLTRPEVELLQKMQKAQEENSYFTSSKSIATGGKFGPNYISTQVPIDNTRISSFANNENEVRVIDSSLQFASPGPGTSLEPVDIRF